METSLLTERLWLAKGLQDGYIRQETAVEIMKLLDNIPTKWNNLPVYPTIQTVLEQTHQELAEPIEHVDE